MANILYTYEWNMPTVSLFKSGLQSNAHENGIEYRIMPALSVTEDDLSWCDVLHMIRPDEPYSVYLAKCARKSGCFVIAYYDDDLYSPPEGRPTPPWRIRSVKNALKNAHMVASSSPHISKKYQDFTLEKRSHTSDTVVNPHEIKRIDELIEPPDDKQMVKLVYAANAGHVAYFNRFIMPIMPKLCQKYAGKISMIFMGVRPQLKSFEDQITIEYFSSMPLEEYRQKIRNGNFDIGLSPLSTDEFSKCKYFNKFLEYTMAGIVGMYSNTEPYTYIVKDQENGFLVNDDPEDWYQTLCAVIDNALLRNQCVRNAQTLLLNEFTYEKHQKKERQAIPEMHIKRSDKKQIHACLWPRKLLYHAMKLGDKAYKAIYFLRRTGFSGFVSKLKTHLKERKAFVE